MAKELVCSGSGAAAVPAAQYIRMSTEHQRYSPDSQRAAIAAFAAYRGFEIVQTYQDAGKSGLTLHGRPALKKLLADVLAGQQIFRAILVLDVSRWGRFQDTDQAAHYEFMCREAGVSIHYCTEPFDNDGGPIASIVKHMKRVMAAEFSRELSTKVSRAQRLQAQMGFKQGSTCPYGLRRQVVDDQGRPRAILKPGERKALSTHKVVFVRGTAKEAAVVRRVFDMYVHERRRLIEIAHWANKMKLTQPHGAPWSHQTVQRLLRNPLYVGDYVFGRRFNNLGNVVEVSEKEWVRVRVVDPIIPPELFEQAQARLSRSRLYFTEREIKTGLRRLLAEKGRLTQRLLIECPYVPSPTALVSRFGSLAAAYDAIGYEPPKYYPPNADGKRFSDDELIERIRELYERHGYISVKMIKAEPDLPAYNYIWARLGGITKILNRLGVDATPRSQRLESLARTQGSLVGVPGRFNPRRHRNEDGSLISDEQLIGHLKRLLAEHGHLTTDIIANDRLCPDPQLFRRRLGSMPNAYALAGYAGTRRDIALAAHARRRPVGTI